MRLIAGLVALGVSIACGAAPAETVQPIAMSNRAIGGSGIAGTPTGGVENGQGLHNIGLLIKTFGKVTYVDPDGLFFYIDDGSALQDGFRTDASGVRVSVQNLAPGNVIDVPAVGSYVAVVGISSTYADGAGKIRPNVRPRSNPDVAVLQVPPAG